MRHAIVHGASAGPLPPRSVPLGRRLAKAGSLVLVGAILMLGGASPGATTTAVPQARILPDPGAAVGIGGPVRPVAAWTDLCRRKPEECAVDVREAALVSLDDGLWRTLTSVNRRVNARIKPLTDQAHWNVVDRWDYPDDGFGDCEDYQLLKRRMLVQRGMPRRALLMTVVIDDIGEGHAVLTVRTDRGDLILDNKTDAILPWRSTGYAFIKREGQDSDRAWVSLEGGPSPTVTANR